MPTLAPRRAIAPVVHPGLERCPEAAIPTPALPSRRRPRLPQEESGFRHRTRPVVCRKTIWCRYWSGEVSQIALRTLQIVDQFLFAEVKGIHTIIGPRAEPHN